MHVCKICGMELPSKKALVYHLSSKTHKKQSVYCPWCNVKNVITRVTDLKAHCLSKHFVELDIQPKNFIGGNNCFYFAVYPGDYIDIFKPEPWANPMAVEARRLMMNMTERVGMSLKERDQIREGWKHGREMSECNEKKVKIRKRTESEKSGDVKAVYESLFTAAPLNLTACGDSSKYDSEKQPKKKVKLNIEENDQNKKDKTSVNLNRHKSEQNKEQRHQKLDNKHTSIRTEKDNNVNKYIVKQSKSESDNKMKDIDTDLEDEDDYDFQTIIKLETGEDGIRRLITSKQKAKEGEINNKVESNGEIRRNEEEMIMDVGNREDMKKDGENDVINDCRTEGMRDSEVDKKMDDGKIVSVNKTDKMLTLNVDDRGEIVEDIDNEIMKDDEIEDMIEDDMKYSSQNTDTESKIEEVDSYKMSEKGDGANHGIEEEIDESENENEEAEFNDKDMAKVWKNWNLERPMTKAEEINKEERSIKFKVKDGQVRRVIEIPKRSEVHKKSETEEAVGNLLEKELRDENLERNDTNELEQTKSQQKLLDIPAPKQTFAERAIGLLNKGAMPLCPPGRRDWRTVMVPLIIPVGTTSFSWPPIGWQNMSADRKLLEWEAASWKLECITNGFVPAHLSRRYLLDKYMYLALPGSKGPLIEPSEKSSSASRAFTYKMVKELARGERPPTKAEEDHLSTLEFVASSELSRDIDFNSVKVPLVLKDENEK